MSIYMRGMKKNVLIYSATFLILLPLISRSDVITGKVQEVLEGDTLTVKLEGSENTEKIRIYGIDAPDEGQKFFEESKKFLTENINNKEVKVEILTEDNQGFKVAKIYMDNEQPIGNMIIKEGYAWWDEENAKEETELKKLCASAIREKKGLWADPTPLAPWDYRKSKGLPEIKYAVHTTTKEKEPKEEKKEEPKVLKAKGNEVYKGTFSSSGQPYIDISKIQFDTKGIDPNQLLMNHMPTVAKDASGNPIGLAVPNISQIPYATMLGFQDGDIITSVNGIPIRDFSQIMPLYEQLKGVKELSVQVLRNGQPTTLNFRLP